MPETLRSWADGLAGGSWCGWWRMCFSTRCNCRPRESWTAPGCVLLALPSWLVLAFEGGAAVSNAHLAISVGGGLGLIMLLNTWGVVWRAQKRLIAWSRAS